MLDPDDLRSTVTGALALTIDAQSVSSDPSSNSPDALGNLPSVGAIVGNLYQLLRVLGEGMFGKVYVAQRVDVPEHQVALKLMKRSLYAGRNVERELVMLATVGHPHVVQLKDHGMTSEYVWLTMPVYDGETLFARLKRGPLGLREAYDIFVPVAHALEALHAAGLRHQDIKPENIFLAVFAGRIHPILLDLGAAAEREAFFVAGTVLFASPEQLLAFTGIPGAIPLSEKMDTYCIATSLLMALVGPGNFPGNDAKNRDDVAFSHEARATQPLAEGALPELQGAPRVALETAFKRWLALDPVDRPSMNKFAAELDVLLEPEREAARVEQETKTRQKRSLQRFRLAIAGMLVVGVAALGILYWQRETLRLASELREAQNKSAESFDKLDTCIVAHRMSNNEVVACRRGRDKDRSEFRQQLDEIMKSGTTSEAEHARQVQALQTTFAARVKSCEDAATAAEKAAAAERERQVAECQAAKTTALAERDEARTVVASRELEAKAFMAQRDECAADRKACIEQRAACEAKGVTRPAVSPAVAGPAREPASDPPPAPPARPSLATAQEQAPPPPPPPPPAPVEPAPKPADVAP